MALLAERAEAMRAIWTQEEATYHGQFVHFDRVWSWPKPAQRPHPPVLVGGDGPIRPIPLPWRRWRRRGILRVLHWLPSAQRSGVEAALDRSEAAIATLHGE